MKRLQQPVLLAAATALLALAATAAPEKAGEPLSVDQIVRLHIEAKGGRAN